VILTSRILTDGQTTASQNFVDFMEDGYLAQHVRQPTCKGSILDLVITSDPEMIDTISVLGPLGSNDHNIMEWTVNLDSKYQSDRFYPDYSKANFTAIRQALDSVDWIKVLQGDANMQWTTFMSIIRQLETKYVKPKKLCKGKEKAPWMTYEAVKYVNKKHKMYQRYKNKRHPAYIKAARQADAKVR